MFKKNAAVRSVHSSSCSHINRLLDNPGTRSPGKQQGTLSGKTVTQAKASQAHEMHGMPAHTSTSRLDIHAQAEKGRPLMPRFEPMRKEVYTSYIRALVESLKAGLSPEICAKEAECLSIQMTRPASDPKLAVRELIDKAYEIYPKMRMGSLECAGYSSSIYDAKWLVEQLKYVEDIRNAEGCSFNTLWKSFTDITTPEYAECSQKRMVLDSNLALTIASGNKESPSVKKLRNITIWHALFCAAKGQYPEASRAMIQMGFDMWGEIDLTPELVAMTMQDISELEPVAKLESRLVEKLCERIRSKDLSEEMAIQLIDKCIAEGGGLARIAVKLSRQPNLTVIANKHFNTSQDLARMLNKMQFIEQSQNEFVKRFQTLLEKAECTSERLRPLIGDAIKEAFGTISLLKEKLATLRGMDELDSMEFYSEDALANAFITLASEDPTDEYGSFTPTTEHKTHEYESIEPTSDYENLPSIQVYENFSSTSSTPRAALPPKLPSQPPTVPPPRPSKESKPQTVPRIRQMFQL